MLSTRSSQLRKRWTEEDVEKVQDNDRWENLFGRNGRNRRDTRGRAAPPPAPAAPTPAPATPAAASGEGEVVTAPMPGTVTKILVKSGDAVTENQPLMILEAMKMENEIVAPKAGTVGDIIATLNQSVNSGDGLISII